MSQSGDIWGARRGYRTLPDRARSPSVQPTRSQRARCPMSLHDLTAQTIDHKAQPLSAYKGQVLLVVNTASECGSTPQYAGLEELWRAYKGRGLAVLGFPSNDFGAQEPGTEAEIKTFCSTNYHVTFPMFAKVGTKGPAQSP